MPGSFPAIPISTIGSVGKTNRALDPFVELVDRGKRGLAVVLEKGEVAPGIGRQLLGRRKGACAVDVHVGDACR
jgi:hypothetical protein